MLTSALSATLFALGFYSPEAGSFQLDNAEVSILVDFFDTYAKVHYYVGCQGNGTWKVTSAEGLLAELKKADANFTGYPNYKNLFAAASDNAAPCYMVGVRVVDQRGNLEGRPTLFHFDPSEHYGRHATNIAAKRAYLTVWRVKDDISQWSDDFVKLHFDTEARNEKTVKILRVT